MAIKKGNAIKKWLQYIWDYTDSYLDNWPKKILFVTLFLLSQLAMLYVTLVFDVGMINLDISLSGMLKQYQVPGVKFPFGVLLVLSLCIDFTAVLIIWKNGAPPGGRNFKLSKSNTYGSGREISKRELAEVTYIGHKDALTSTIYGQLDESGKQILARKSDKPNNNMLVFGPPGSGKSTSYVLPFITQAILRRESVCVSDTKGEVYAKTVELARLHGYQVLRLDLKNPECSDGWNVLKELRNDDVRALVFAKTVMANTNSDGGKDIHAAPEESLLKACCLYQERVPHLSDSQRTFYNAFQLLLQSPEDLDATFMGAFSAHGEQMQVVMDSYSTFLQGSPNLRGNILTGLANRLQVLASPPVRRMTSTDEIDFTSLGKQPTILYISMSDQHQTMSFLASLAFSFAFLDLVDLADHNPGQRLKVPVHFLMEEFGNLGYIPNIDKYLSTARSRGISINLVVQSLAQLVGTYEENLTNIILADCAIWMCLACNDESTAKLLEWRSGEATIQVKTLQHDALEPPSRLTHKHSTGDGRRNFYTSNDIMKIKEQKEAFIVWQGKDSLICLSFPIFMHREFQAGHMPEVSADSLIPLSNEKAKVIFRQWEQERIRDFRKWMAAGGDPLKDYKIKRGKKSEGPAANEDMPSIIPIHTLERMALAKAAGKEYDFTTDPDSPHYVPPEEPEDDDLLDLSGWVLETVPAVEPAPKKEQAKKTQNKKAGGNKTKKAPVEVDDPRPVTTPELNDELDPVQAAAQQAEQAAARPEPEAVPVDVTEPALAEMPQHTNDQESLPAVSPEGDVQEALTEEPEAVQEPAPQVPAAEPATGAAASESAQPQKTQQQKKMEQCMNHFEEKKRRQQEEKEKFFGAAFTPPKNSNKPTTALEAGNHKKLSDASPD